MKCIEHIKPLILMFVNYKKAFYAHFLPISKFQVPQYTLTYIPKCISEEVRDIISPKLFIAIGEDKFKRILVKIHRVYSCKLRIV